MTLYLNLSYIHILKLFLTHKNLLFYETDNFFISTLEVKSNHKHFKASLLAMLVLFPPCTWSGKNGLDQGSLYTKGSTLFCSVNSKQIICFFGELS